MYVIEVNLNLLELFIEFFSQNYFSLLHYYWITKDK